MRFTLADDGSVAEPDRMPGGCLMRQGRGPGRRHRSQPGPRRRRCRAAQRRQVHAGALASRHSAGRTATGYCRPGGRSMRSPDSAPRRCAQSQTSSPAAGQFDPEQRPCSSTAGMANRRLYDRLSSGRRSKTPPIARFREHAAITAAFGGRAASRSSEPATSIGRTAVQVHPQGVLDGADRHRIHELQHRGAKW